MHHDTCAADSFARAETEAPWLEAARKIVNATDRRGNRPRYDGKRRRQAANGDWRSRADVARGALGRDCGPCPGSGSARCHARPNRRGGFHPLDRAAGPGAGPSGKPSPAMRAATRKPVYVDCNAVSPETVGTDHLVRETGANSSTAKSSARPLELDSARTRIYLSGPDAETVAVLEKYGLAMPVLPGPIGAASAMKMSYAGIPRASPPSGPP